VIEDTVPRSWRDFQTHVAAILSECGVETVVEKELEIARGRIEIDVWAHDASSVPAQTYLIECKHWSKAVPQAVVHGFRTVVGDSGANWGAIVSSNGFQRGAHEAAQYTNVVLLSWETFQELFVKSWLTHHFYPVLRETCDPLLEYTEPINSRISTRAKNLSPDKQEDLARLRRLFLPLSGLCIFVLRYSTSFGVQVFAKPDMPKIPSLPLRNTISERAESLEIELPDSVLDATSYRGLLTALITETEAAIGEFDAVFGQRA
jgi:restriction system protein